MNTTHKQINVTAEDKKAHKAQKALEKQKRKDRALQKPDNDNVDCGKSTSNIISNKLADDEVKSGTPSIKDQEKPNRKEKAKQKVQNDTKEKPVKKNEISKSIIDDQKQKVQRVKSSDRVSFSDNLKNSSSLLDGKFTDYNKNQIETIVRKNDSKQVSYFKHLFCPNRQISLEKTVSQISDSKIHRAIKRLGCDLDSFKIRGSTLRCLEFFKALKEMIRDLPVENNKCFSETFSIALNNSIEFLDKCRPLASSMLTAIDYLKINISLLREENPEKCRNDIIEMIDQFQRERINVAHQEIENSLSNYIKENSKILVYSYSEIVCKSILQIWNKMKSKNSTCCSFQVFVVDVFPDFQGEKMMNKLKDSEIPICRTNLSSVPKIMPQIDLVVFGAHSIMPNNNVISASGTASVANTAKTFSIPVIVCVETYKINLHNHFDGFAFNEIGNPDFLVEKMIKFDEKSENNSIEIMKNWRNSNSNISVLDLLYDVIPGSLISGIICELGFISSSAASFVSRIKQPYY